MFLEKLRFSKCPHCKQHGIDGFVKTTKNGTLRLECKYCKKHFKVDIGVSIIFKILVIIAMAVLIFIFKRVPEWIWYIVGILLWLLSEYFLPVEQID